VASNHTPTPSEYFSDVDLFERGWTKSLIQRFLQTRGTLFVAGLQYLKQRVYEMEGTETWKWERTLIDSAPELVAQRTKALEEALARAAQEAASTP
jgi:hypothetical protein